MIGRWMHKLRAAARGRSGQKPTGAPRVYYGFDRLASRGEKAFGGTVKFQSLQDIFPNTPSGFNLLYLVSSGIPPAAIHLVRAAKQKGARFVWNQNGVAFPAWHGPGWERVNEPMRDLIALADHVFYQSDFCRRSADRFTGPSLASSEILYNAVDTRIFQPLPTVTRPLTVLVAGSHWQWYRVQTAIDALAEVRRVIPDARLVIAGRFCWATSGEATRMVAEQCRKMGVESAVEIQGTYSQLDAPRVLGQGDILLHAKCNDPCPTLVLEAMACGLPVVYSASGGVPELVGETAGFGIHSEVSWETHTPPDPALMAKAILNLANDLPCWREAARTRALRFDVQAWRQRHRDVFTNLMKDDA